MIKRIIACLLVLCIVNFVNLPVFANDKDFNESRYINAEFKTEFNANKAEKGQVVQFISTQDYQKDGIMLPTGTIYSGEVKHLKKGRWGYRRAKAIIKINKVILPDGQTYEVNASTKRRVLKGSGIANVGKGIVSFPIAIVVGATGTVVIIVETVSIVGLLLVGPTSYVFGETMGKLTHGVNYKKHQGDEIKLKIKAIKGASI